MLHGRMRVFVMCAATVIASCGHDPLSVAPTATATVTPTEGGVVALLDGSARLDVPPGAVTSTTSITIVKTARAAPSGLTARSPVFELEPSGLQFARPVAITLAFDGAVHPTVFWSNAAGGFDAIGGRTSGSRITAEVTHFSSGFVGELVNGKPDTTDDAGPGTIVTPSADSGVDAPAEAGVDASADAPVDVGASSTCVAGTSCQPGEGCSQSGPGACVWCACGADGRLACSSCSNPWSGSGPAPPTDCGAGPACLPGDGCAGGGTGDGCVSGCQCGPNGHFACTVKCQAPAATNCANVGKWVNRTPAVPPTSWPIDRNNPALAFDVPTARTVMYGGYGGPAANYLSDTWEWDGRAGVWTERKGSAPAPFDEEGAAYDSARTRLVLFGNVSGQLWEWNGPAATWEQRLPVDASAPWPAAGTGDYAAYDPIRRRLVLFQTTYGVAPATWEWNPADGTWTKQTVSPAPNGIQALVWDPVTKRPVAFGGQSLNEVWEWNGDAGTWTNRPIMGAWPEPRSGVAMTVEGAVGRPLLFGGQAPGGSFDPTKGPPPSPPYFNQLWEWHGEIGQWRVVDDGTSAPSGRTNHAMAYDSDRSSVVMFGGAALLNSTPAEVWEWTRSTSPVPGCP